MRWFALLIGLAWAALAQASEVWRCGADGRSYSDSACPGGRAVLVADARDAEQQRAAREVVRQDWALAQRLAHERREREREARQAGPGLIGIKPVAPVVAPQRQAKKKASSPQGAGTWPSKRRVSRHAPD